MLHIRIIHYSGASLTPAVVKISLVMCGSGLIWGRILAAFYEKGEGSDPAASDGGVPRAAPDGDSRFI